MSTPPQPTAPTPSGAAPIKHRRKRGKAAARRNQKEDENEGVKTDKFTDGMVGMRMSDRYNEDDGDVIILSSDGVTFKVHSYLLRSSS